MSAFSSIAPSSANSKIMHSDTFITAEEKRKLNRLKPNSYKMKQAIMKLRGKSTGFNIIAHNDNDIFDLYNFTEKDRIGRGAYGNVVKAEHLPTGNLRAIKMVDMESKNATGSFNSIMKFRQEIEIMKQVQHPHVIRLYETFEDKNYIYLVMELCQGGELFDRIVQQGHFTEGQVASITKDLLTTLNYLHKKKIMHRDLKPENFLFVEKNRSIESSTLKLIDFGLATTFHDSRVKFTKAGTPYYVFFFQNVRFLRVSTDGIQFLICFRLRRKY